MGEREGGRGVGIERERERGMIIVSWILLSFEFEEKIFLIKYIVT